MLKGFKHLIDIEEDYIQILLADIKALDDDMQKDIERFIFQNDTDLGKEERPIFREKIRLQITAIIENASFFEDARQGKSDKAIEIFKRYLFNEIKYRYNGGIALSSKDNEGFYNHLIETIPTFAEKSLFAFQDIYPDANTDMSETTLEKRRYMVPKLAEYLPDAFNRSELGQRLRNELDLHAYQGMDRQIAAETYKNRERERPSHIYNLAMSRVWVAALSYYTVEKCMDLAEKNPPAPPEPPQKSKWNLFRKVLK